MKSFFCQILLLYMIFGRLSAQGKFELKAFESFNFKERYAYALKVFVAIQHDTVAVKKYLQGALPIARQKKDHATEVLLQIQHFSYLYYIANHQSTRLVREAITEAIQTAEEYDLPIQLNIARIHYGGFLYKRENSYDKAYEVFLRAYEGLEEVGFEKMQYYPGATLSGILYYPGLNFYQLDDYANAIKFLQTAYQYPDYKDQFTTWQVMNTLGLCYLKSNQPEQAIKYFRKGHEYAKSINSEIWQGISYGNIGNTLIKSNKYTEALPYVKTDYETAKKRGEKESMFNALSNLMLIYYNKKQYKESEDALKEAEEMYRDIKELRYNQEYFNEFKLINIYRIKAGLYETEGNAIEALAYNKKYIKLKDSLDKRNDARKYKLVQQRLEAEKYVAKVNKLEEEKKTEIWKRNSAIFILVLGLGFGLFKYRDVKAKQKQAESQLDVFTKNFKAKSELADSLQKEINEMISQGQQVETLEQLKKKTILTEDDWSEFKILFDKVYPDFINNLYKQNPDITHAEVRLLALSQLNLRDHEMANMLGVSTDAIRKARYRFRKKTTM
ncbi:hypothetical protein [Emticicia sp. C21]|uniref:tetratricopeptide repeat protein n=1 Tax=Emticicia sp. C21 TaxID=2302915 RepID=UPI001314BA2F|nr:hypothetical protein [Emticicia sp. C21]